MIISLIVAASENDVIGKNNALPWSLPDDLKYFRDKTQGKPVIMGRKTYDSIGKPLPERLNIVLTTHPKDIPGCTIATSLEEALRVAGEHARDEIFVIGGSDIFAQLLRQGKADRLYLTRVHATVSGEVPLPTIDWSQWKQVSSERHAADDKHAHAFTFFVFERKR